MATYIIELESDNPLAPDMVRVLCEKMVENENFSSWFPDIVAWKDDGSTFISDGDTIFG